MLFNNWLFQSTAGSRVSPRLVTTTRPNTEITKPEEEVTKRVIKPQMPCTNTMKAVFLDKETEETYIINDDKAYVLNSKLIQIRGPIELQTILPDVKSADAVYRRQDGRIILFKDTE